MHLDIITRKRVASYKYLRRDDTFRKKS